MFSASQTLINDRQGTLKLMKFYLRADGSMHTCTKHPVFLVSGLLLLSIGH